jgi:molybdopterin molybdotransferase
VAETETFALKDARGRVLAAMLCAPIDLPPFDNSAVDGYAVRHADLGRRRDETRDRRSADRRPRHAGARSRGEAIRIFTGAPMPPGADTVFMQEDVRLEAAP